MPTTRQPRSGSLQFWPRKRARRATARIRTFPKHTKPTLGGYAGYKVGMTHIIVVENRKNSPNKGNEVMVPVTIIECPSLKILSARFYKKTVYGLKLITEIFKERQDKELSRRLCLPKKKEKKSLDKLDISYDEVRALVYTQPKTTSLGKKKPEIFEVNIGGSKEEQYNYVKENFDKEINIRDVFNEADMVDVHAVTKGKGYQGPVRRFGISLRQAKSEKAIRNPGSLGPWCGQGHVMWRVAHAGKMGYHQRTHYNKQIYKISDQIEEITPAGGFLNYGNLKNTYVLIRGSVPGHRKRLVLMTFAGRSNKKAPTKIPAIEYIGIKSKQGR
ncbi:50S ribosomal protein L3 [Candidatus Woesearchaeota archaeon]|nr:50S ribosomal protein L3 [Candidatus Woesearchaeota archaeon]